MNFQQFKNLFIRSLEIAADNSEKELGKKIPRANEILFYGAGHSDDILDVDTAANLVFIDEVHFYRIIDIAVQLVSPRVSRIFVRLSGHKPVSLDETWTTPKGSGPFKQLIAQIQEVDS